LWFEDDETILVMSWGGGRWGCEARRRGRAISKEAGG